VTRSAARGGVCAAARRNADMPTLGASAERSHFHVLQPFCEGQTTSLKIDVSDIASAGGAQDVTATPTCASR